MLRVLYGFAVAVVVLLGPEAGAVAQTIEVWKTATCGCCKLWVDHLHREGFSAKAMDVAASHLARIKAQAKLPAELHSCHTAKVGGYVVEGHVPAADIRRLLEEKPDAIGLSVPGMPIGSPGMEVGETKEPYEVILIYRDGTTRVFSRH